MIRAVAGRLRRLRGQLCVDLGDYRQTVFLTGTGRSGTTLLANVLNHDKSYRVMFEPFSPVHVGLLKQWHYKQYLRADNREEKFLGPARRILSGKIRHGWIDKLNRKIVARKRIIKDIRTQYMLPWIKHNFPEIPIVMLLRHPCAVANSRLRLGWSRSSTTFSPKRN